MFLLLADGTLITPPLRDDLLPGVTRRALLDHARDESRPAQIRGFDRSELTANAAFWTGGSPATPDPRRRPAIEQPQRRGANSERRRRAAAQKG